MAGAFWSMAQDMTVARETITILRSMPPANAEMDYHRMSLWAAAVMAYTRPFTQGYRRRWAKSLIPTRPGSKAVDDGSS